MTEEIQLREGHVLTGACFSEPMLVETVRENRSGVWVVGMVGQRSERFRRVTLTAEDLSGLTVRIPTKSNGDSDPCRTVIPADAER